MARRPLTCLVAGVIGLVLPAWAAAAQRPGQEAGVLPNFDIRATAPSRPAGESPAAQAAIERLLAESGAEAEVRRGRRGTLRSLVARGRPLSPPASGSPETVALRFLADHQAALGLEADDVAGLTRAHESASAADPLVHVTFRQTAGGLRVFGAAVRVHLTRSGEVVGVATSAAATRGERVSPTLGPAAAVEAATAHVRPELAATRRVIDGPAGPSQRTRFDRGPFRSDVEAELVLFPMPDGVRLAWHVVLEPAGIPQKYDVLVDASTGELLYRRNRVLYADGAGKVLQSDATRGRDPRAVDEHPAGAGPSGFGDPPNGCPPVTNHLSRSLTAPFRDPATVLSGSGRLEGNNVHVFRGSVGVEGESGVAQPDGSWTFDFPFGTAGSAETHLFFLLNYLHDFFYDLGFDEASGNFQADNFGRGGAGRDSLHAVARADGRNNATFEPMPDGQSPVLSMFLWDGTGCWAGDVDADGVPDLDGAFDADAVIHEFHHGVSTRLNTEFTGAEADAIGEGGSDFFAYSLNGDTRLAEYAYPPEGIREINGRTYGSWSCLFGLLCEPHDNGEIWANVLWDLRERFRTDVVGGSQSAGVRAAHLLYVDGLKLSPPSPSMLDLRNAMVQADRVRRPSGDPGGSVNYCRIWETFTLRGMGAAARDTYDTGSNTVVEDFSMPAECPPLPAAPTVTLSATDADAAEAGRDPGTFTLARDGDASRALSVYLAAPSGSATEGTDYLALPRSVTLAAGQSSATVVLTPVDDPQVEATETATVSLVPGVGYRIGVPSRGTISITSDDVIADLVVSSLSGPSLTGAGAALTVSETTKNQGTDDAASSVTRYFLSANTFVDAGDVALGNRSVPALAAGASSAATVSLSVPAGTAAGAYNLVAQADADGAVTEGSEANNLKWFVVRVGPDLRVSALSAPASASAGSAITVSDTTRNDGGGSAAASSTAFYLSANSTIDAGDSPLGSRSVTALSPGVSHAGSTMVTLPSGLAPGTYYLLAQADGGAQVAEAIETNNVAVASMRIGPDYTVGAVSVSPAATAAGSAVSVTDTTRNTGGGDAPTTTTRFYLSLDSALDGADIPLGDRSVPPLAAGGTSTGSTSVTIPAGTGAATYYVLAQADATGNVAETSESNNVGFATLRVGPDYAVRTLTVSPTVAGAGMDVVVTDTTANNGGGSGPATTTRLYLSSNSGLDASDVALGGRAVPPLSAGGTSVGSTRVAIPPGTASGTYYVLARADGGDEVVETSETNNLGVTTLKIGSDYTVGSVSVSPTTTGAGATITVTETTRNSGGSQGPATVTRFYLSANTVFDAADVALGGRAIPDLAGGASSTGSTALPVPADIVPATWYLVARADGDDAVEETSESNNSAWVSLRVGPDLVAASLSAPGTVTAGLPFSVTETTQNQGGALTTPSVTRFYLSVNGVVDGADIVVGERVVSGLAPGTSQGAATTLVVPPGTPPGRYYLIARADADDAVPEYGETNNARSVLVTVQ